MFIKALLAMSKTCKQHKYSSTGEQLNKTWYIYTKNKENLCNPEQIRK